MEIGIGLPTTIPGVQGHEVIEWARRADAAGFSTLGTIDRSAPRRRLRALRLVDVAEGALGPPHGDARGDEAPLGGEKRGFAGGVGPDVSDNPPKVFLGGRTDPVFKRAARVADGSMMGGGPPEMFGPARERLEAAWQRRP